jgi:DNA invertase Pin-like site-specific DNA recombinase
MNGSDSQPANPDRPEKLRPRQLERLAVVYIRQSSMQQVHRNQESTRLQYSLASTARQWGWAPERVLVIDEDLGLSGASAAGRQGFQRLLAEVALDHVGLILGAEMSRLARSNTDWHQLLELCARFGTLIADLDGLYDPSRYNDRLLLGLKGTMSEAELHILRQRLLQGKLQKARRGELSKRLPSGYIRLPGGEVALDPDEEVRAVVALVFSEFARLGTVYGVLRVLVKRQIRLGVRSKTRRERDELVWKRPHRGLLLDMLRNPTYAGAYVYGRRQTDPRRQVPGRPATGRASLAAPEQWIACIRDRLPAFITWEQYEANQAKLRANRSVRTEPGAVRGGAALLQGLVTCGRCGRRMMVHYSVRAERRYFQYVCGHDRAHYAAPACSGLSGPRLDGAVVELALAALEPAALEVSLRVAEDLEAERQRAEGLWQKRLQRARYEAERAERQYQVVEPENRLVARTLESAWEQKLREERELREEYERHQLRQPRVLAAQERAAVRDLASNLPELWNAPTTTVEDRKAVLRILIERIIVTAPRDTERVDIVIEWAGGHRTSTSIRRAVARLRSLAKHTELLDRIRTLRREGHTAGEIADQLNADGWVTPTQRSPFNERLIRSMLGRYGTVPRGPRAPAGSTTEWPLSKLAAHLDVPLVTLYGWLRRGWLNAHQDRGLWVVQATDTELERLRGLRRQHPARGPRAQ